MELQIHPSAVIHKDAELADGVKVGPNCVIDSGVSIGTGTILEPNVVISKDVKIGENNHFFPNCVIGNRPQTLNLSLDDEIGRLVIGDGNVIHEQVTIHPGMHPGTQTTIGNNNFIMIGAHIGHDCTLGDKIVMSNLVQIGGHCKIDNGAWFSGLSGAHQFVTIGKWCYVAGLAGITRDIPPFLTISGHYPPRVRGVNKRGLKRAGLDEQQQMRIFNAYKKLYRKKGSLLENAKALTQENGLDENVQAIIDSITKSSTHQYGRYLETFR
ncbi:MAG: acyl-ACP--UDP-N-acetylglucosamine O-acyltransferase [Planctomycetes bacterium]|nr:acyl-ACP--UDP-N-acetylglucosamine O-acyltransferase [Planctomycetota bacterium]MBL7144421.1 acyl-ACP--UDP-N-acetylglucosamine O-acyltransferase [Phycisphaerae bacterium]